MKMCKKHSRDGRKLRNVFEEHHIAGDRFIQRPSRCKRCSHIYVAVGRNTEIRPAVSHSRSMVAVFEEDMYNGNAMTQATKLLATVTQDHSSEKLSSLAHSPKHRYEL